MPYCPNCGKQIGNTANFCRACGFDLKAEEEQLEQEEVGSKEVIPERDATRHDDAYPVVRPRKNPGVALFLSFLFGLFLIFGVGHFYVGSNVKGFAFLIIGLIIDAAGIIVLCLFTQHINVLIGLGVIQFVIWVLQIGDAYDDAMQY